MSENLRANVLDAADALTGTGKYDKHRAPLASEAAGARSIATTTGAGIGAGANPMRGTGVTDGDAARVAHAQRGDGALAERGYDTTTTSAAGTHTGAGAGVPAGAQSVGPAVAGAAPAGPGMVGGAVV
jgi:hypothetical protein